MTDDVTPPVVDAWDGRMSRCLRLARRMSVREFADHLGVSDRIVSKWEAAGTSRPKAVNQSALDTSLARCDAADVARFRLLVSGGNPDPATEPAHRAPRVPKAVPRIVPTLDPALWADPEVAEALAARDVGAIYRYLQRRGVSQRKIAAHTGQGQSEISEVLAGREIISYDVLVRIAEGLSIPRGRLGLAYTAGSCECESHTHSAT